MVTRAAGSAPVGSAAAAERSAALAERSFVPFPAFRLVATPLPTKE